jgi:hypothetical protein
MFAVQAERRLAFEMPFACGAQREPPFPAAFLADPFLNFA